ncbi:hypothetical protein [Vibrio cyclitrophicus]|uniref:hypothetical protein n=1 Tax=Vibrio cyclitrophicus TaxID=47951 RepID=UPI0039996EDC
MITIDKIAQALVGASFVVVLYIIFYLGLAFHFSVQSKGEVLELVTESRVQVAFYQKESNELLEKQSTLSESDKRKLEYFNSSLEREEKYLQELKEDISRIEERLASILKGILGMIATSSFLLATVNFIYKYQHCLEFFITRSKGKNQLKQRIVITNRKDRNETIIGAYLKGKEQEVIELFDLTCEPRKIDSFGHITIFFDSIDKLLHKNHSRYFKLYVILGTGETLKCTPIRQWKTAKGEKLIPLDCERRLL